MPEWLQNVLTAVGGGSVVLIGVLTIFKKLFLKLFETGIESSFEKNLEKYRNTLSRTTKAYEILLDREMRFYERIEPIIAELIPLEHDLCYWLESHDDIERVIQCEKFKEHFRRYGELIISLKNETLSHQTYIPQEVFNAFTNVVKQMQDDLRWWHQMATLLFAGECEQIDDEKNQEVIDKVFALLACAEVLVRKRLKQLSGED